MISYLGFLLIVLGLFLQDAVGQGVVPLGGRAVVNIAIRLGLTVISHVRLVPSQTDEEMFN